MRVRDLCCSSVLFVLIGFVFSADMFAQLPTLLFEFSMRFIVRDVLVATGIIYGLCHFTRDIDIREMTPHWGWQLVGPIFVLVGATFSWSVGLSTMIYAMYRIDDLIQVYTIGLTCSFVLAAIGTICLFYRVDERLQTVEQ